MFLRNIAGCTCVWWVIVPSHWFICVLTYLTPMVTGALLMLYFQLIQVLLARPKRGRTFWMIVAYSGILFPLATLAIGLLFKFGELSYIDNRNYPGGPIAFYRAFSTDYINVIGHIRFATTLNVCEMLLLTLLRQYYRVTLVCGPFNGTFLEVANPEIC